MRAKRRDLGRHVLLPLLARLRVAAATELLSSSLWCMACWNTLIERDSAPISSRRVAVGHRHRAALGDRFGDAGDLGERPGHGAAQMITAPTAASSTATAPSTLISQAVKSMPASMLA